MSATELLDQVLRLPREEQAELVRQVVARLEDVAEDDCVEPSPELIAEIKRRRDAIRRGETKLLTWDEVRAHLEQILARSPK